jgi:hypothetical protein
MNRNSLLRRQAAVARSIQFARGPKPRSFMRNSLRLSSVVKMESAITRLHGKLRRCEQFREASACVGAEPIKEMKWCRSGEERGTPRTTVRRLGKAYIYIARFVRRPVSLSSQRSRAPALSSRPYKKARELGNNLRTHWVKHRSKGPAFTQIHVQLAEEGVVEEGPKVESNLLEGGALNMQASYTTLALAACLLVAGVSPSTPAFIPGHTVARARTSAQQRPEEYERLRNALQHYGYRLTNTYINSFESSAKCPFRVLRARGFTRVMCDFTGCYSQKHGPCLSDCQQAYMSTKDLRPRKSKMARGEYQEIEMGCIYTPKQSAHSIETAHPGPSVISWAV